MGTAPAVRIRSTDGAREPARRRPVRRLELMRGARRHPPRSARAVHRPPHLTIDAAPAPRGGRRHVARHIPPPRAPAGAAACRFRATFPASKSSGCGRIPRDERQGDRHEASVVRGVSVAAASCSAVGWRAGDQGAAPCIAQPEAVALAKREIRKRNADAWGIRSQAEFRDGKVDRHVAVHRTGGPARAVPGAAVRRRRGLRRQGFSRTAPFRRPAAHIRAWDGGTAMPAKRILVAG